MPDESPAQLARGRARREVAAGLDATRTHRARRQPRRAARGRWQRRADRDDRGRHRRRCCRSGSPERRSRARSRPRAAHTRRGTCVLRARRAGAAGRRPASARGRLRCGPRRGLSDEVCSAVRQPRSTSCTWAAPTMGSSGTSRATGWRMNGRVCGPPSPPWKEMSSSKRAPLLEHRIEEAVHQNVGSVGEPSVRRRCCAAFAENGASGSSPTIRCSAR